MSLGIFGNPSIPPLNPGNQIGDVYQTESPDTKKLCQQQQEVEAAKIACYAHVEFHILYGLVF